MHFLYADGKKAIDVGRIVLERGLDDVTVSTPFMGRALVSCASSASRDLLAEVLELSEAAEGSRLRTPNASSGKLSAPF